MPDVTRIFPVFAVRDLGEALAYYRDVLGFEVAWTWNATRAGVALGGVEIQLDDAGQGAPIGTSVAYCHMSGVETYYEACRDRGAQIAMELAERPWGMKDFRVLDPSGNRIGFGERL